MWLAEEVIGEESRTPKKTLHRRNSRETSDRKQLIRKKKRGQGKATENSVVKKNRNKKTRRRNHLMEGNTRLLKKKSPNKELRTSQKTEGKQQTSAKQGPS